MQMPMGKDETLRTAAAITAEPSIDFFSHIMLGMQMMFSFMLTDTEKTHPYLQALFADLRGKQTECNLLQSAVQE